MPTKKKAAVKNLLSSNDHTMKLLVKSAKSAIKAAEAGTSLAGVQSCITSITNKTDTQSYKPLASFAPAQGVLNAIGRCINAKYNLKAPYRWADGVIQSAWTIGALAASTDVFRHHQQ